MYAVGIINFGSLNIDHAYSITHFVRPGETLKSDAYNIYCGGKGLNQSIAAAKAGGHVLHAGMVGEGGGLLLDYLKECGVDTGAVGRTSIPQGHAIIQVSADGENGILLYGGSNFAVTKEYIDHVLDSVTAPQYVILQNEISNVPYIIAEASRRGHKVVFNASPFEETLREIDLKQIAWLMVNEIEGEALSGEREPEKIIAALQAVNPDIGVVLTLGSAGAICCNRTECVRRGIFKVPTVDTTAAGDTFTGYFVAALDSGKNLEEAILRATAGAAIAVTRKGAGPSIPSSGEVDSFITEHT